MTQSDNTTPHQAKDYDAHVSDTIPYYQSFHRETLNIIKATGNEPEIWLDTGCGTGSLIKMALKEFPNTRFILGDPSQDMLNNAREKLSKYPSKRMHFLEPIPTQQLTQKICQKADIITAIQSHHYLSPEERKKAINTCYDLLNENGVFITFENIRPATKEGIKIGKNNWKSFQLSCGQDEKTVNNHLQRFDTEYFPITIENHLELLKDTGFRVVELFWFSYMQAGFYCIK
jgi:tRNA (cmo5U34)-methyltransferase